MPLIPVKHAAILLFAFMLACGCQKTPEQAWVGSAELDIAFELTDESGTVVTSDDYAGRLRLVFFGFASCPDICPVTLQNIGIALNALGPLAEKVTVLFISVDPKRDTPAVLKAYTDAFHPSVIGLTGTYEQLSAVTSGFRTTFGYTLASEDGQDRPLSKNEYESLAESASYFPYHSSQVYVIGRDDELLDIIGYGSKPALIEQKLHAHIDD
jgi:protein SCO1/2